MNQQQRIDRLAEWMGVDPGFRVRGDWNPFTSHDDAHLLLEECERRGWEVLEDVASGINDLSHSPAFHIAMLMATAEQITEAVEAVAFPEGK